MEYLILACPVVAGMFLAYFVYLVQDLKDSLPTTAPKATRIDIVLVGKVPVPFVRDLD